MAKNEIKVSLDGGKLAGLIVKFFEQQREEIWASRKKERIQMNINPDSFIGKEILYQTALLKSIKEDIAEIKLMMEKEKSDLLETNRLSYIPEDKFTPR